MQSGDRETAQDDLEVRLQAALDRLVAGDRHAKDDLIAVAYARLEKRAHQMLGRFPVVRRSNDTGDVVQEACLRLARSLDAVHPEDPRRFLGLAGLQIRRVLIDLYRHCRGPESYDANHATNVVLGADGEARHRVDDAADAGGGRRERERASDPGPQNERVPVELRFTLIHKEPQGPCLACPPMTPVHRRPKTRRTTTTRRKALAPPAANC